MLSDVTLTVGGRLMLEYECDGWWHIEQIEGGKVYDWYCEGFDTATRLVSLLQSDPAQAG